MVACAFCVGGWWWEKHGRHWLRVAAYSGEGAFGRLWRWRRAARTTARRRGFSSGLFVVLRPGLTEPVGTSSKNVGTGRTGPDRFRFRPVPNRSKFKI
jgi:hypothetical protein